MLLAVLLGKELELALLRNVARGSQPLDGLETRLVRLPRHNAALVLHQVALLEPARRVGGTAIEHLLLGTDRGNASTARHVVVLARHVILAHHVVLTRHVILAAVLAHHAVVGIHVVATSTNLTVHGSGLIIRHSSVHVVLPKQHIFLKEGRVSSHRKRTVLNGPTNPGLQPLHIRNWI